MRIHNWKITSRGVDHQAQLGFSALEPRIHRFKTLALVIDGSEQQTRVTAAASYNSSRFYGNRSGNEAWAV